MALAALLNKAVSIRLRAKVVDALYSVVTMAS